MNDFGSNTAEIIMRLSSKNEKMLKILNKILIKLPIGCMIEEKEEIKQLIKEATEL